MTAVPLTVAVLNVTSDDKAETGCRSALKDCKDTSSPLRRIGDNWTETHLGSILVALAHTKYNDGYWLHVTPDIRVWAEPSNPLGPVVKAFVFLTRAECRLQYPYIGWPLWTGAGRANSS